VNNLKAMFSRLLTPKQLFKQRRTSPKPLRFPADLSTKFDVFQYLNFNIPELQPVKLSLDFGQQEKAFEQFFHYIKMRHTPTFICNWWKRNEIVQTLKAHYPESVPILLKAADNILQHRFLLFARHVIHTGTPIFWSGNYDGGIDYGDELWEPGKMYSKSKLLADRRGDIRFVWELNRHQHFLDLGKAYWYTGEEEFVQEFISEIVAWIAQNPYPLGVNWVDSYEIALRGLFWIFGYTFFFSSEYIDEEFFCRFYQTLLFHGHAVYESLQTASQTLKPHHVVANASFLHLLGTIFPEYIHSKTWNKFGWEILQWESDLLTLEQTIQDSLASLVNTIELYCIVLIVRRNNRYHIPPKIIGGLKKMLEQLMIFVKPDGSLSRFGEERPIQLTKGMYAQTVNFRYLFAMAAVLLRRGEFKMLGNTFEEPLLWFFGRQGGQEFAQLAVKPLQLRSYLMPDSSYVVMRSGWEQNSGYCLISNGVPKTTQDHELKHADLLSFELFANGSDLLIDSGPYSFQKADEWNQYFRSLHAHNGIIVDGIKHINFSDRRAQSEFDQWVSTPIFDFLSGYHSGFEDLEEPVRHRRSIFYFKPNYWIISDLLTGEGQHFLDQYFHFPPFRLNVDFTNKRVNIEIDRYRHFTLMPLNPHEMDVMIFTGGDSPDSGWISDGYKYKVEAPYIKYGKRVRVPTCFHTLLYAYDAENPINISGRHPHVFSQDTSLLSDEVSVIEIAIEQETHYFVLMYKKYHQIHFDNITFSGELFFLRKQGDEALELILHNATLLTMEDMILFQSESPVDSLFLRLSGDSLHVLCSGSYSFQMQLPQVNQVFVNTRRSFFKRNQDMIFISTSRV
jgi:hypothetical protein